MLSPRALRDRPTAFDPYFQLPHQLFPLDPDPTSPTFVAALVDMVL